MTLHAAHSLPLQHTYRQCRAAQPSLGHHPQRSGDITEEDPAIPSVPWAPSGFFHRKVCLRAKPTPSCPLRVSLVKIKKATRLLCVTLSAVAHFCNSNPHSLSFPLGVEGPLIHHSETLLSYDVPTSSCVMLVPQLVGFLWEAVALTQVEAGVCH